MQADQFVIIMRACAVNICEGLKNSIPSLISALMTLSKKDIVLGSYLLVGLNIFFATLAVIGQVFQNVSLPLWVGSTEALGNPNCTSNKSQLFEDYYDDYKESEDLASSKNVSKPFQPGMDPFFVLSFASLSFVIIFGVITACILVVQVVANHLYGRTVFRFITKEDDLLFPQWQMILIGVFDALNGVFVVFASSPSRTAPFLQAILGNFTIPLTIVFRWVGILL